MKKLTTEKIIVKRERRREQRKGVDENLKN